MFNLQPTTTVAKPAFYADLLAAADALTAGESDSIANMANIAALLFDWLPDVNWAGFYRVVDGELVLGPFQGKAACIRIALGQGVCGAAASTGRIQLIQDVQAFPGHIACDAASRSELVVPLIVGGRVAAVIDLDSPSLARFDGEDRAGIEALATLITPRVCP